MTRVLLVEPYFTGSHRAWALGYRAASSFDVDLLALPGRFWKWRMHGAAVTCSRWLRERRLRPDVVLAGDMLDLAAFLGLARDELRGVPAALYVHENQAAYPPPRPEAGWAASRRARAARRDEHYPFVNLTSMLAADVVLWNSQHNRRTFIDEMPRLLRRFPDHRESAAVAAVEARSQILPLGLDLRGLDAHRPDRRPAGPPRVLWNHRWEHDKAPEVFFRALHALADRGVSFRTVVLGESFGREPEAFATARRSLGDRIEHWGYVEDRADYARWLWSCDVVVSTARHEFFGAAVAEAAYCGCRPVLPAAMAYPELVPDAWHKSVLYAGFDELVDGLQRATTQPDPSLTDALAAAMAQFDWTHMAPRYDQVLAELLMRPPARFERDLLERGT